MRLLDPSPGACSCPSVSELSTFLQHLLQAEERTVPKPPQAGNTRGEPQPYALLGCLSSAQSVQHGTQSLSLQCFFQFIALVDLP